MEPKKINKKAMKPKTSKQTEDTNRKIEKTEDEASEKELNLRL